MTVSGVWVFLAGCGGGVLAEFISLWNLRKEDPVGWPKYYRRLRYWVISLGMILVGGGLTVVYGVDDMPLLLALNVGASAPLLIQRLLDVAPPPPKAVPDTARVG